MAYFDVTSSNRVKYIIIPIKKHQDGAVIA